VSDQKAPEQGASQKNTDKILYLLKTRGELTATVVGELLNMTMMGARQLLQNLEADGFVESVKRSEGRGRPKLYWSLTDKGHGRFPDRHSDLTLSLITGVAEAFGEEGLNKLIKVREQQSLSLYQDKLRHLSSLDEKINTLTDLRSQEGYMAESVLEDDGSYLLIENHCPICAAAQVCQGFCRSELDIFRACLGVEVERVEYMLDGARRCAYRIYPS